MNGIAASHAAGNFCLYCQSPTTCGLIKGEGSAECQFEGNRCYEWGDCIVVRK